jgi:5-hydroxyisourate hydrolase-like protein (transthyretin family)
MNNLSKVAALLLLQLSYLATLGCEQTTTAPATSEHEELEPMARTEFTQRIENFFEYEPLRAGKISQFRIHLTDLSDGSPVEQAKVTLTVHRTRETAKVSEIVAKVGKVTGIYVAELTLQQPGQYEIEFHIKNARLDERLSLSDFKVE